MINVPHYQAECGMDLPVTPDNIHTHIYFPPYFATHFPLIHYPIASAVNTVINDIAPVYVEHCKTAYVSAGWDYGKDISTTCGGKPSLKAHQPLIPAPTANGTAKYQFWGYKNGSFPPPNKGNASPLVSSEDLLAKDNRIDELENELALANDSIQKSERVT